MPGIQKMFEAGEVRFSSLHNFCPLPVEVMGASPDCYKFSSTSATRTRARGQANLPDDRFRGTARRAFCRAASRRGPDEADHRAADRARESGRNVFARICAPESESGGQARSGRAGLPRAREGMPQADHRTCRREKHPARRRRTARLRRNPERARTPGVARRTQLAAGRLLARHRSHPDQGKPRLPQSRGMAARDRAAHVRLSRAGLHLAGAGSSTALRRRRRSGETGSASARRPAYLSGK